MMDTILNLGLNDADRRGAEGADRQRPLRLRQLPPLHPDVRQRRPRDSEGRVRARVRGGQARARRASSTPTSTRTALQEVVERYKKRRQGEDAASRSRRIRASSCAMRARRRVPLVDEPARAGVPPHLRHPRPHRHRRQRADDGVRQHRRPLGHRRRLHAQPGDRREGVLRRVPDQRAGRGRRRRHPHAAADRASSRR